MPFHYVHAALLFVQCTHECTERHFTQFMLHVLDVRDAMDSERFQQVQFDPVSDPKKITHNNSSAVLHSAGPAEDANKEQGEHAIIHAPHGEQLPMPCSLSR